MPCPPPGDLPDVGNEPRSPALEADSLLSEPPGSSVVKDQPAMQETHEAQVRFLSREDPLKEKMATRASIPGWRMPWTEEPGRLWSTGSKESDITGAT